MDLVVDANLDILLRWGNHLVLNLALECGKFLHGLVNDSQGLLDLLLGNDQWWCQADDVLMSWLGLFKVVLLANPHV